MACRRGCSHGRDRARPAGVRSRPPRRRRRGDPARCVAPRPALRAQAGEAWRP